MPTTARKPAAPKLAATATPAWEPKGAAAKLAYIQAHIDYVPKTGRNTHQKFDYFQEHGILALLRPFQRQLKVAILVDFGPVTVEGNMTSASVKVTLIDTEAEPSQHDAIVSASYPMQATDNQGWGAAKLLTYGKKFALQKFFGIPAEELPEAEQEAIAAASGAERPIAISAPDVLADLREFLTTNQADSIRVRGKLTADFGVNGVADLMPSQVDAFRAWAKAEVSKKAAA